jgi:hypothetical protein
MSSTPTCEAGVAAKDGGNSACARYLAALFSHAPRDSLVEVRTRTDGGMRTHFFELDDLGGAEATIAHDRAVSDVYVGVLPRVRPRGTRADLVREASVLWADCDTNGATAGLNAFEPAPSIIVASGTHANRHAYWLLDRPVDLDTIEAANRRLAYLLGADARCADAARILRPPSLNHKHQPPRAVRLLRCAPTSVYRVEHVVGRVDPARPTARQRAVDDPDVLRRIEPRHYFAVLADIEVPQHRKVRCPFHDDRTPSLHVYEDAKRGWYCFGCGHGGSIYDFAALLWGYGTHGPHFVALRSELLTVLGDRIS